MNLPECMIIRTLTNKRRWTGKPNDDMVCDLSLGSSFWLRHKIFVLKRMS